MGNRIAKVLDSNGKYSECPDFPTAVVRDRYEDETIGEGMVVDPIFNEKVARNLYGRIMTIVEATTDASKLQPVKDLFSKELRSWENDVYSSARELAEGGDSSNNIYTRRTM